MVTTIYMAGWLVLSAASAEAAPGRVVAVQGTAAATRIVGATVDLMAGDLLEEGDVVKTGDDSYLRLMMRDGSVLDLASNTHVDLRKYEGRSPNRKVSLKLWVGRLWARVIEAVDGNDDYVISGSNAVVGIRGTELIFDSRTDGSAEVTVLEGRVSLTSLVGDAAEEIGAMERGSIDADGNITKSKVTPEEVEKLRKKGKPAPKLDQRDADDRLNGVRERLQIEVTPIPEPVELPGDEDALDDDDDSVDDLDQFDDDPADPLLNVDPDAVGSLEQMTRVRGGVEVIEP